MSRPDEDMTGSEKNSSSHVLKGIMLKGLTTLRTEGRLPPPPLLKYIQILRDSHLDIEFESLKENLRFILDFYSQFCCEISSHLQTKQVKPGFTNYQPRFPQFFIRTSKIWNNN